MEGKDLIVVRNEAVAALRNEAITALNTSPAVQPEAGGSKSLLAVFAMSAVLSVTVLMWLHIISNPIPSVQSVSIQAQTPPPDVETARSFEVMATADPTERAQEAAAAERTQEAAATELEPAVLQK